MYSVRLSEETYFFHIYSVLTTHHIQWCKVANAKASNGVLWGVFSPEANILLIDTPRQMIMSFNTEKHERVLSDLFKKLVFWFFSDEAHFHLSEHVKSKICTY